jgi:hypothetical protein
MMLNTPAMEKMKECLRLCSECAEICEDTLVNVCLAEGGKHTEENHIRLMMDCIQICQVAAGFMRRESEFHMAVCAACAEVCDRCGQSCKSVGGTAMKECADICRRCASACHAMSGQREAA